MLTFLASTKIMQYVFSAVLLCMLIATPYVFGRVHGYEIAVQIYKERAEDERERIQAENQLALDFAAKRVRELEGKLEERNDIIAQIQEKISANPNSDRIAIDPELVLELNRLH